MNQLKSSVARGILPCHQRGRFLRETQLSAMIVLVSSYYHLYVLVSAPRPPRLAPPGPSKAQNSSLAFKDGPQFRRMLFGPDHGIIPIAPVKPNQVSISTIMIHLPTRFTTTDDYSPASPSYLQAPDHSDLHPAWKCSSPQGFWVTGNSKTPTGRRL